MLRITSALQAKNQLQEQKPTKFLFKMHDVKPAAKADSKWRNLHITNLNTTKEAFEKDASMLIHFENACAAAQKYIDERSTHIKAEVWQSALNPYLTLLQKNSQPQEIRTLSIQGHKV